MLKKKFLVSEVLSMSFKFVFLNFKQRMKDGFLIIFLFTIGFNILSFLIKASLATNFTIFLFMLFSIFFISSIGLSVHKEILLKQKSSYFNNLVTKNCFMYFLNVLFLSFIAISPLIIHYILKKLGYLTVSNINISYLFFLWIFSVVASLKLIFILPKIALDKKIKYSLTSFNVHGSKLFLLFISITVIFFIPSFIILSAQISFLTNNQSIYLIIKPIFDFASFSISYLNYLVLFAAISYSYQKS